jgi:hypothetical protein
MTNFSLTGQLKKEISEFESDWIQLVKKPKDEKGVRYASNKNTAGNYFNQQDTIATVDLFYNSVFENGAFDDQGERKIFMNIMKFRCDVSTKQIDLDVKNFKFVPDDYASPFTAMFMSKDFKEWSKDNYFGEILNKCAEAFPKYGTVVLKKVGKEIKFVPLQNLKNEQTAECLDDARYVIEEHVDMYPWEIKEMKDWNLEGLELTNKPLTVYERYGYVPRYWLTEHGVVSAGDPEEFVDSMVVVSCDIKDEKEKEHIFYCKELKDDERPYQEAHWSKQVGRWLGVGVGEDLISNQRAKNIVVNLKRRNLSWSSKKIFQTKSTLESAKNLVRDVEDGDVIDVGVNGDLVQINTQNNHAQDYELFSNEWDHNSDQKAFTYAAITGEGGPAGTAYRLGVLMTDAANSFFGFKRQKLGLFLTRIMDKYLIPQFIKDMTNKDRIISYFSDEPGYDALKQAAMDWVKQQAITATLLGGETVDVNTLVQAIQPYEAVKQLLINLPKTLYKEARFKFDLDITGEAVDVSAEVQSLTSVYQLLVQKGDPRADTILDMITHKVGIKLGPNQTAGAIPPMMNQVNAPGQGQAPKPTNGQGQQNTGTA